MIEKPEKIGPGLEIKTFRGRSGKAYLVFRARGGDFHIFSEVNMEEAAMDCGVSKDSSSEPTWENLWQNLKVD